MSDRESSAVGFRLRGFGPPDLSTYPDAVKLMFWQWVTDEALRVKDRELAKGWDKDGQVHPLRPRTIKYRKSEVGPVTKTAPRLEPALKRSRVRALLRGRAHHQSAELYWDFDAVTGDSFAVILHFAAEQGHDVFGLSDRGTAQVRREALDRWQAWNEAGHARPRVGLPGIQAVPKREVKKPITKREVKGRLDIENFTLSSDGEKLKKAIEAGEFTGFRRLNARGEQWKPGTGIPPTPPGTTPKPTKPKPAPKPVAPSPTSVPAPAPQKPSWKPGDAPIDMTKSIGERIKLATHLDERVKAIGAMQDVRTEIQSRYKAARDEFKRFQADFEKAMAGATTKLEKQKLNHELTRLRAEEYKIGREMDAHTQDVRNSIRKHLDLPAGAHEVNWDHVHEPQLIPASVSSIDSAKNWLQGKLAGTGQPLPLFWKQIPTTETQRAYASAMSHSINLSTSGGSSTAIHEWGHQIEFQVKGAYGAIKDFLDHRVGTEAPVQLNSIIPGNKYDSNEMGRADKFLELFGQAGYYVGKQYGSGDTEIMAMGLQKLYDNPLEFAKKDPEYLKLILGILDGSLRKP